MIQTLAILALFVLLPIPQWGDPGAWPPGHNKVDVCHEDPETGELEQISVPPHAAAKHLQKHAGDFLGFCPEPTPEPTPELGQ